MIAGWIKPGSMQICFEKIAPCLVHPMPQFCGGLIFTTIYLNISKFCITSGGQDLILNSKSKGLTP
jgi:hypothetical protein